MYTNESNRIPREDGKTHCGRTCARVCAKERMHFSGGMLHSSLSGPEGGGGRKEKAAAPGEPF